MLPIVSVLLAVLLVLIFAVYFLKPLFHHLLVLYYAHKVPGPPSGNILFGNMHPLIDTQENSFKALRTFSQQYRSIYKLWVGHLVFVQITNPEDAGLVLSNVKHNQKSLIYNIFHNWLQNGVFTSSGEKWVQRRKLLTPAFHFTLLQDFLQVFSERTSDLVEMLKEETDKPYTEINDIFTNLSMRIIAETALGHKFESMSAKEKAYERAIKRMGTIMMRRLFSGYLLYHWIYLLTWDFFKELKIVRSMHNFTKEVITEREKNFQNPSSGNKKKRLALLDLLFTKKTEGLIEDSGIREEVNGLMFGGHDTIAGTISFGLMLIACNPQIQEKIVEEMQEVLGDITKKPSYKELQELHYMKRCLKETLRLYPGAPNISRILGEDIVTSSGYKLKKNTILCLSFYDIHHNPELYPDPEKFDPDRFLLENCKERHPFAYLPFSAGTRNCLGQKFAMLELKAILCGILGNFILKPVDTPETIVPIIDVIFRSKENIKVKFIQRT